MDCGARQFPQQLTKLHLKIREIYQSEIYHFTDPDIMLSPEICRLYRISIWNYYSEKWGKERNKMRRPSGILNWLSTKQYKNMASLFYEVANRIPWDKPQSQNPETSVKILKTLTAYGIHSISLPNASHTIKIHKSENPQVNLDLSHYQCKAI